MLKGDFLTDRYLQSQPERLTFHNLAYVSAWCAQPRLSFNDRTLETDVWAANDVVSEKLGKIFYENYMGFSEFELERLDIYPVIYLVSKEERKSMTGMEELENKFILSTALLTYCIVRTTTVETVNEETGEPEFKQIKNNINYSIILEQSLDGYVVPLKEIIVMLFNSAINYNRGIKYVPHKDMQIVLNLPKTIKSEIDDRFPNESDNPFNSPRALVDYINHTYQEEAEAYENKYNQDNLYIEVTDDTTVNKLHRNFPTPYIEIMEAYKGSFRCNPMY